MQSSMQSLTRALLKRKPLSFLIQKSLICASVTTDLFFFTLEKILSHNTRFPWLDCVDILK